MIRGHLLLERGVEILAERHVLKHPRELGRVLESARILQFRDHVRFGVLRGGREEDESLRQHLGVELQKSKSVYCTSDEKRKANLLENVLVLDVLEHGHLRAPSSAVMRRFAR